MRGISILDKSVSGDRLAFDLLDVLQVIKTDMVNLIWKIEGVECLGDGSKDLHALAEDGEYVSGKCLLELVSKVYQVIEGEFIGYKEKNLKKPWVVIRSVDSFAFDVECEDTNVLHEYKMHFKKVIDIPK